MLPEKLIPARIHGGLVIPSFLGPEDIPWVTVLLDEVDRFRGRPVRELEARLREPLPCASPHDKTRAAVCLVSSLWRGTVHAEVSPRTAREAVFSEAAQRPADPRDSVVCDVARKLSVAPDVLRAALFADLPGERIVAGPIPTPTPTEIGLRTNEMIAKSILSRATVVHIEAEGGVRPVVRQAKLRGLLCQVEDGSPPMMSLSGPFALFRRTLLYGRALAGLISVLPWCGRFALRAECILRGASARLELSSGAPIFPGGRPKPFDSKLEERFAGDLKAAAPDWDLLREPEAIRAGGGLIFPDFLLRHRLDPRRQFLVELVGFWTPDYLAKKLNLLKAANIKNLIVCIDEERQCGDGDLPAGAMVIRYRRRIDPAAVLRAAFGGVMGM